MPTPKLGVCYYPEHWPEARWALDARMMRAAGLSLVRIGEFAWSRLEPRPGEFDFGWLDRAIATLGEAGLGIVLGTPTATPPRWMLERHPDMLAVDAEGRPRKFGSRRHYCFAHEGYRAEAARIAGLLGERYGRNPHVVAWQIDNEYGCHDTVVSYSDAAARGFRRWLAARYGDVSRLDEAWGNVFWSMEYTAFEEIDPPNLTVTEANPAHTLDYRRFLSDAVVAFNAAQVAALRPHTDAPLSHNYMGRILSFDHFAVGRDLEIATWDSYPLGFLEDRSDQGEDWRRRFARQGDPDFQAFHHDLYRAVGKGRWWVMEQQPGPVNWAPHNPAPLPGMVALWTWEAIAHGAEAVCYFRWRQVPFAQEQMHAGLLRPDAAPAPGLAEARAVADALDDLPETGTAPVGLVVDYQASWVWETERQGAECDYFRLVFDVYRALRCAGLSVDILPPTTRDLSAHALVLAPGLAIWPEPLREALAAHDGIAIAGPRTGAKTDAFRIPEALPPQMPGVDARVTRIETLRDDCPVALAEGGAFRFWREFVEGDAPVLEACADGEPALVGTRERAYLAGWPDDIALDRIVRRAAGAAGLATLALPDGLRVRDRGSVRFVMNYSAEPVSLDGVVPGATGTLPPAGTLRLPRA
ncbi:beta-galactosidase [Salinarimonas ramus]|uniref:Beta-galactosidase n=1 Tax=Salinarimonas ramus TaxID=690164 RepID=A0A917QJ68_9HYPH|nr:beta-galactosidase [Salinarimonas ramus]GGK53773.1 beta-galactosidase [Salinarimonas ramus]